MLGRQDPYLGTPASLKPALSFDFCHINNYRVFWGFFNRQTAQSQLRKHVYVAKSARGFDKLRRSLLKNTK